MKYKTAKSFINRCPLLLTAQQQLEFGPDDQPAMDRRLRNYSFKSLPNPIKKPPSGFASVVWASNKARPASDHEESSNGGSEEDEASQTDDGILNDKGKEALRRWLRETEKDLYECVEESHQTRDPYFRANVEAYADILFNKVKLYNRSPGTYNTAEALEQRRRVGVDLGILRQQDQHLVRCGHEPFRCDQSDDESMLLTPLNQNPFRFVAIWFLFCFFRTISPQSISTIDKLRPHRHFCNTNGNGGSHGFVFSKNTGKPHQY